MPLRDWGAIALPHLNLPHPAQLQCLIRYDFGTGAPQLQSQNYPDWNRNLLRDETVSTRPRVEHRHRSRMDRCLSVPFLSQNITTFVTRLLQVKKVDVPLKRVGSRKKLVSVHQLYMENTSLTSCGMIEIFDRRSFKPIVEMSILRTAFIWSQESVPIYRAHVPVDDYRTRELHNTKKAECQGWFASTRSREISMVARKTT